MAINKIEIQDSDGNIYYPHTDASVVKIGDSTLEDMLEQINIIQTAGGSATAIILTNVNLVNGFTISFLVATNNNGAATTINGKNLYKFGGTAAPTLTAGKVVTVWYNGTNFFIKASIGNATADKVLAPYTISNDYDTEIKGTMADNGPSVAETINLTSEGGEYTIPVGYHSGLRKIKAAISNIAAAVIKAGVTVGGIAGTFTADATALASQMLAGVTAYVNGNKITGTIVSKAAATYNPSTSVQTIAAAQYLSGLQTIAATTGTATPADVLSGKTFNSAAGIGLVGTMAAGKRTASGTTTSSGNYNFLNLLNATVSIPYLIVSGLTFLPSVIVISSHDANGNYEYLTVYHTLSTLYPKIALVSDYAKSQQSGYNYPIKGDTGPAYVNSTGFCLPVTVNGLSCSWVAYE